MMLSWS